MFFVRKLFGCFFCWRTSAIRADPASAQAVLALSFGKRESVPGKSNEALAKKVKEYADRYHIPFAVQGEVGQCLLDSVGFIGTANPSYKHDGTYVGTFEASLQLVEGFCKPREITSVIIVAHPDHAWRVVKVCEKLQLKVVLVDTDNVPYDDESTQPWCRSAWRFDRTFPYPPFKIYEVLVRLKYLLGGKI